MTQRSDAEKWRLVRLVQVPIGQPMRSKAGALTCGKYPADDHFGWCPECGRWDGYLNVGKSHVGYCDAHRVQWSIGWNLFSSWRDETEEDWDRNAKHLYLYREVDSHTPTPAMLDALMKGDA